MFLLITVRNLLHVEIIMEPCSTREEALGKMKTALFKRLKIDHGEEYMSLLEDGVELSNAVLHENDAYIYQDYGKTYHHWKIVEFQDNTKPITKSTTMIDGVTQCCGYDFGLEAFGRRKPKFCPICAKKII